MKFAVLSLFVVAAFAGETSTKMQTLKQMAELKDNEIQCGTANIDPFHMKMTCAAHMVGQAPASDGTTHFKPVSRCSENGETDCSHVGTRLCGAQGNEWIEVYRLCHWDKKSSYCKDANKGYCYYPTSNPDLIVDNTKDN